MLRHLKSIGRAVQRAAGGRAARWRLASLAGLVFLLGCVAVFATDAGLIWDEPLQAEYGDRILDWFASGFRDRAVLEVDDLYLYGGLFEAPAQLIARVSPLGMYETRHVLTALCALLGIVAAYRIAARLGGTRAGFFAGAILFLTPRWTGHGLFNPKDIPFGAAAAFTAEACVAIALGPALCSWRAALLAGTCAGLALGVRSGGMFLYGFVACTAFARAALALAEPRDPAAAARVVARLSLRLGVAAAIAWALMIAFWPWAQLAPFSRPLEAARIAAHFDWNDGVLFNGHVYTRHDLPRSYLPTWLAMTLPELYALALLAGVCALALSGRERLRLALQPRGLALALLVSWVCAPIIGVIVKRPTIYDGQRHFLFLLPALAALAGWGLSAGFDALESRRVRTALAGLALACAVLPAREMIALHPYEYVYFNRISGGLRHAAGRFETEYWGASYAAGFDWIARNVAAAPERKLRVGNAGTAAQTSYYLARSPGASQRFEFVEEREHADLVLATTRFNRHKIPGDVLHTIDREGVPLLYVIRTRKAPDDRGAPRPNALAGDSATVAAATPHLAAR